MAWTTKSSRPQSFFRRVEQRVEAGLVLDVGRHATILAPSFSTSGSTRLPNASPW